MRPFFFDFLPQLLDWVVIRRIARQLEDRQALDVCTKEPLHRSRRVIPGPILNQHDWLRGLRQYTREKGDVRIRVEAPFLTLIPETAGEVLDQAEDFVAFALARCFDHWLVATSCPGVRERAPLGEGGFIPKQEQRGSGFCCVDDLGPGGGTP